MIEPVGGCGSDRFKEKLFIRDRFKEIDMYLRKIQWKDAAPANSGTAPKLPVIEDPDSQAATQRQMTLFRDQPAFSVR